MNEIAAYILRNFPQLLTAAESKAHRTLMAFEKSEAASHPGRWEERLRERGLIMADDAQVVALLADGEKKFYERIAHRIQAESGDQVALNHCAKCGRLARTPVAKQCLSCGHDWH
jgi:hypothetical protein